MDQELDRRLRELEDLVGSVAVNTSTDCVEVLDVRNELEDVEGRLNERLDGLEESIGGVARAVESQLTALHTRLDEIAKTVQEMYADMPTG